MAKVKKTPKGYKVVHSTTGVGLSGTYTGRGAKGKAQKEARVIRKRNM